MKKTVLFLATLTASCLNAAETDQFTNYFKELKNSKVVINTQANKFLQTAIIDANKISECVESDLYVEMRKYFNNPFEDGKMITFLREDESVDRIPVKKKDSIYKEWSFFDGAVLATSSDDNDGFTLVPEVRMDHLKVGIDKFEHFFGSGFDFFTQYHLEGKKKEKVLKNNFNRERYFLGGRIYATGVFSYGDVSANFNGIRFWNSILQNDDDILGENRGPHIKCENNQWVQVKEIDFLEHMDEALDETINCSKFPAKGAVEKVLAELDNLSETKKKEMKCPMRPKVLEKIIKKYGELAPWLINTDGHSKI